MPAPQVRAAHEDLKQIATLFQQEGDNAQQTLAQLRQNLDQLQGGGWKGRGATAFFQEMNSSILPSLRNLQRALEQAGRVTTQISARLRQCEADAANQLQDRTDFNGNPADSGPGNGTGTGGEGGSGGDQRAFGTPYATATGQSGWSGEYKPSEPGPYGFQAGGVASGQYAGGQVEVGIEGVGNLTASGRVLGGEAGWGWNRDVQGAYADGSVLQGKTEFQLGGGEDGFYRNNVQVDVLAGSAYVGHRGSNYGIGAEVNSIKISGGQVFGTKDAAFTTGAELAGPSANAYAGVKDGSIGAEAGASWAGVKGEAGFNVFGWNVGLVGEADLGAGIGASIGKKTSVKIGPFAVGITFGSAK